MKTYIEHRIITDRDLRELCADMDWLTHGTAEEHGVIFSLLRNDLGHPADLPPARLAIIAEHIRRYSDTTLATEDIMSALAHISISYFMPAP